MSASIPVMHLFQDIILKLLKDFPIHSVSLIKIVGFKYLWGLHLNDTKKELGTRVDRHDSIGKGFLGSEMFSMLMNDNRFDNLPLILETPDETLYEAEIKILYSLVK